MVRDPGEGWITSAEGTPPGRPTLEAEPRPGGVVPIVPTRVAQDAPPAPDPHENPEINGAGPSTPEHVKDPAHPDRNPVIHVQ